MIKSPVSNGALQRRQLIKRILLPLDGSAIGEGAIPYAEALARALQAELVLFMVLESTVMPESITSIKLDENHEMLITYVVAYLNSIKERM